MSDELLTTEQVAERLKLKPYTVLRWARRGLIPVVRLNERVVRFRESDVEYMIDTASSEGAAT